MLEYFNMKKFNISPMVIILGTVFLDVIGIGIIVPVLPLYVESFGASHNVITALFAIFAFCSFFSSPILGIISDRKGRRPVLLISLLSSAVGWIIFALSHSIIGLFIGRIIDGMAAGNISTAQNYLVDIAKDEKERSHNLGLIGAVFGVAFIIGPLLGGVLSNIKIILPFIVVAILTSLNTILAFFFLPETHHQRNPNKISWNPFTPIQKAFASKKMVALYIAWLFFGIAVSINQPIFALYLLSRFGWGVLASGFIMGLVGIIISLNQAILIKKVWLKYFSPIKLNLWILLPFAVGYFVMGLPYKIFFIVGILITSFGHSIYRVTMMSQTMSNTDKTEQGEVMGVMASLMSLSMIIGPIIGGFVYNYGLSLPFYTAGLILLIAFIVMLKKDREMHLI